MKKKQAGLSLIGVLIVGILLALIFLIGMRTVPVVTEYFAIQRVINAMVANKPGPDATVTEIRRDFEKRAAAEYIESVNGNDLAITKRGSQLDISVEYDRKVPIVGIVSLLFEFDAHATSK